MQKNELINRDILIIEDEILIASTIMLYLKHAGFNTFHCEKGLDGLRLALEKKFALIILDISLPDSNGVEICKQMRLEIDTPIIMLTARSTEDDKINGLEAGADDYICKPFSNRELVARVRVQLRRNRVDKTPDGSVSFAELNINIEKRKVRIADKLVDLTQTEFDILAVLINIPGKVFTREVLLDRVFQNALDVSDRTVDVHINNLRKKIESNRKEPFFIKTVFGIGYRFGVESND